MKYCTLQSLVLPDSVKGIDQQPATVAAAVLLLQQAGAAASLVQQHGFVAATQQQLQPWMLFHWQQLQQHVWCPVHHVWCPVCVSRAMLHCSTAYRSGSRVNHTAVLHWPSFAGCGGLQPRRRTPRQACCNCCWAALLPTWYLLCHVRRSASVCDCNMRKNQTYRGTTNLLHCAARCSH